MDLLNTIWTWTQIAGAVLTALTAIIGAVWVVAKRWTRQSNFETRLTKVEEDCRTKCGINDEQEKKIALLEERLGNIKETMDRGFADIKGLIGQAFEVRARDSRTRATDREA